jgi:hypothetical protein
MTPITADHTLTYEEFREAMTLQRHRKRFLTGPPQRSPWIGCAVIAAMGLVTLILFAVATFMTGTTTTSPSGATYVASTAPVALFLWSLLPWFVVVGIFWLMLARSSFERRILWQLVALMLAIGATASLVSTVAQSHAKQPAAAHADEGSWVLGLLPLAVGVVGLVIMLPSIRRWQMRAAWDGQPQIKRATHVEASEQRLLMEDEVSRHEYAWRGFISYSEGPNIFVLSISALTFSAIPKRAFADAAQVEQFRALLRSHMVDAEGKSQGFDVLPALVSAPLPPPPLHDAPNAGTPLPPPRLH